MRFGRFFFFCGEDFLVDSFVSALFVESARPRHTPRKLPLRRVASDGVPPLSSARSLRAPHLAVPICHVELVATSRWRVARARATIFTGIIITGTCNQPSLLPARWHLLLAPGALLLVYMPYIPSYD